MQRMKGHETWAQDNSANGEKIQDMGTRNQGMGERAHVFYHLVKLSPPDNFLYSLTSLTVQLFVKWSFLYIESAKCVSGKSASFEASLNGTKLAMLPIRAYAGKSKINSTKKRLQWG